MSDAVNGKAVGRENDKERILAYNIEGSMHDINFAAHIYQMLGSSPDLIHIALHDPAEKF